MPFIIGSTTPIIALVAMAASTALPPLSRIRTPACDARGDSLATIPPRNNHRASLSALLRIANNARTRKKKDENRNDCGNKTYLLRLWHETPEDHPARQSDNDQLATRRTLSRSRRPRKAHNSLQLTSKASASQTNSAFTGAPQPRESKGRVPASKLGLPSYQSNVFLGRHQSCLNRAPKKPQRAK